MTLRATTTSRLTGALGVLAVVATAFVAAAPAQAAPPRTDFEMPFPCAQQWTGTTRAGHSPSRLAVDWNRANDFNSPVVAAAAGTVVTSTNAISSGYGRYVVIDHGNNERSVYAHLNRAVAVVGQYVDQGTLIGYLGETGNASGPHLHFEEKVGSAVVAPYFHREAYRFGTTQASQNCVDVPVAGDIDGNKKAEVGVWRRATKATFLMRRAAGGTATRTFGTWTDTPILGDWDGNGTANYGVRTPANATFTLGTPAGNRRIAFGLPTDIPIAGDWNGDRKWEVGVRRAATPTFLLRGATGGFTSVTLGDANDLPVTGDWNGDGVTDLGAYDVATATWTLRYVADETVWTATVTFGTPGDLPVVGDWDGNGRTDLGTWTPTSATFNQRVAASPTVAQRAITTIRWGRAR